MKKIGLLSLLFLCATAAHADECPILYSCTATVVPTEFSFNDRDIKIITSTFYGRYTGRDLRNSIIQSFNQINPIFQTCTPENRLPEDPDTQMTWESIDRDEKYKTADCAYTCVETSL